MNMNKRLREIGILAVILAVAIALPSALAMLNATEIHLLHVAVPLKFSWFGFAILCSGALVVLLAVWAALRHALKRAVRETLAYE